MMDGARFPRTRINGRPEMAMFELPYPSGIPLPRKETAARRMFAPVWTGRARKSALSAVVMIALIPAPELPGQQSGEAAAGTRMIELIRELVIGADPGVPEYEFAAIGSMALTRAGTVFVSASDGSEVRIRRYDHQGRYQGLVGRSGAGPGEYRVIAGMAVVGDTLVAVYDRGNGRVALFDTAGVYRGAFRVPGGGVPSHKVFAVTFDSLIGVRRRVDEPAGAGAGLVTSVFVRYRLNGEVLDSVSVPPENVGATVLLHRSLGPRWAFPTTRVFALLPRGGIATALNSSYRVEVVPAEGPRFTIERPARPIPLEDRERDEWVHFVTPGERSAVPRHKPIIRDLFADTDGRLWVAVYTNATRRTYTTRPGREQRSTLTFWEHNAYDVFDQRGRYLGRIDLPPFSRLLATRGDRAWVAQETEDGSFILVRYELRVPPL